MQAENTEWELRIITASKQNLTLSGVGLLHSLANKTNIVTPFNLEFRRMRYVIILSSFCLFPEELDLLTQYAHRALGCWEM